MAVHGVSIARATEGVARSVKFDVEQLGFSCLQQLESFARVRLGAADIMLAGPDDHLPWQGPRFTGLIYLEVDDVDGRGGNRLTVQGRMVGVAKAWNFRFLSASSKVRR